MILAEQDQLARVDDWRTKLRPVPSRSEAIRRLIDTGLTVPSQSKDSDKERLT